MVIISALAADGICNQCQSPHPYRLVQLSMVSELYWMCIRIDKALCADACAIRQFASLSSNLAGDLSELTYYMAG